MPRVKVFLRVKQDGKYPYYPASVAGNGRIEPLVAIVNDRRKSFQSGLYYIRFTEHGGKQKFEPVGKDPAVARARQIAKQAELDSGTVGVKVTVTDPTSKTSRLLQDTVGEFCAETKANKARKTWLAYSTSTAYFLEFSKGKVETLEALQSNRQHLLGFKQFLRTKVGKRSVYNNFLNTMVFLKWAKVVTGIVKKDWPPKPERQPEEYTDGELTAMFKTATAEERLVLNSFLCSGFRSGEMANLTYADINFQTSLWRVERKDDQADGDEWEAKTEGSYRYVSVPPWITKKILERMQGRQAKPHEYVFPNSLGRPNNHLLRITKRVAKRAGLFDIRVDDHKFRATCITLWLRNGNSVHDVMSWVGHKSLVTVLRYAAKVNLEKKATQKKAHAPFKKYALVGE